MTTVVTIIRTSARGAHLVSNGTKVAWIQGRWYRVDGTLTPKGVEALENGTPFEEFKAAQEAAEESKRQSREASKMPIQFAIEANSFETYSDKCWRYTNGSVYFNRYGKRCRSYYYAPKSLVKVVEYTEDDRVVVEMPRWYFESEWKVR